MGSSALGQTGKPSSLAALRLTWSSILKGCFQRSTRDLYDGLGFRVWGSV